MTRDRILTGLAVGFLIVYAVPILWPGLPEPIIRICTVSNLVIWVAFWADYLVGFARTRKRGQFVRSNLLELAALVLPVVRVLRTLRIVVALARLISSFTGPQLRSLVGSDDDGGHGMRGPAEQWVAIPRRER